MEAETAVAEVGTDIYLSPEMVSVITMIRQVMGGMDRRKHLLVFRNGEHNCISLMDAGRLIYISANQDNLRTPVDLPISNINRFSDTLKQIGYPEKGTSISIKKEKSTKGNMHEALVISSRKMGSFRLALAQPMAFHPDKDRKRVVPRASDHLKFVGKIAMTADICRTIVKGKGLVDSPETFSLVIENGIPGMYFSGSTGSQYTWLGTPDDSVIYGDFTTGREYKQFRSNWIDALAQTKLDFTVELRIYENAGSSIMALKAYSDDIQGIEILMATQESVAHAVTGMFDIVKESHVAPPPLEPEPVVVKQSVAAPVVDQGDLDKVLSILDGDDDDLTPVGANVHKPMVSLRKAVPRGESLFAGVTED
jgi:hypothetical protein